MPYERMHHGAVRGEVEQKSERFPSAMRSALVCRYRTRLVMRAGGPVAAPSAKARGEPTGRGSSDARTLTRRVPADATARSFAGETSLSFGFPRFSPHSFLPRKPSPLLPSPTRLRNPHEGCWPLSSCAIFEASHSFLEVALAIRRAHLLLIPLPALAGHPLQSKATGSRRDAASVGAPAMSALLFSLPPIRYQSLQYRQLRSLLFPMSPRSLLFPMFQCPQRASPGFHFVPTLHAFSHPTPLCATPA